MSDKPEPNLFLLRDALQNAIKELDKPEPSSRFAMSFLGGYDLTNLSKDSEVLATLTMAAGELRTGSLAETKNMLEDVLAQVRTELPRFRIVLMDESEHWTDKALVAAAGKIWAAYLYDETRRVHLAELTPSYELRYLYSSTENHVDDDMDETIRLNGDGGEPYTYMHCGRVDSIPWDKKLPCGEPTDPAADSYQALADSEYEHYISNICKEVPCKNSLRDMLGVVVELAEAGELKKAELIFEDLLDYANTPPQVLAAIKEIRAMPFEESLLNLKKLHLGYRDLEGFAVIAAGSDLSELRNKGLELASRHIGFTPVARCESMLSALKERDAYSAAYPGGRPGSQFVIRQLPDSLDYVVGQYRSDPRHPRTFEVAQRIDTVQALQGGVSPFAREPLVELLSSDTVAKLQALDIDVGDHELMYRMGAYAHDEHSLFYQYVQEFEPRLAKAWAAGVDDIYSICNQIAIAGYKVIAEPTLSVADFGDRRLLQATELLIKHIDESLDRLLSREQKLYSPINNEQGLTGLEVVRHAIDVAKFGFSPFITKSIENPKSIEPKNLLVVLETINAQLAPKQSSTRSLEM